MGLAIYAFNSLDCSIQQRAGAVAASELLFDPSIRRQRIIAISRRLVIWDRELETRILSAVRPREDFSRNSPSVAGSCRGRSRSRDCDSAITTDRNPCWP